MARGLRQNAAERPAAPALHSAALHLTWEELHAAAEGVAGALDGLAVEPGEVVAIATGEAIELIPAFLGAGLAGAVPAVLDAGSSSVRRAQAKAAAPRAQLATPASVGDLDDELPTVVVSFVGRRLEVEVRPGAAPARATRFASVACVLFTSGTTAAPKGIVWSETRLGALFGTQADAAPGCVALMRPVSHSNSPLAFSAATVHGDAIALIENPLLVGPSFAAMAEWGVTRFTCTPAQVALLRRHGPAGVPQLRTVRITGAPIDPASLREAVELLAPARVTKSYGLTEVGPTVTVLDPLADPEALATSGRPTDLCRVTICAADGSPLPPGEEGEIVLELATFTAEDGYLSADPSLGRAFAKGRLRTGDRGWLDGAGFLTLTARESDLIKVAGKGVRAAHLEAVLRAAAPDLELAVVPVSHATYGQVPAAFYASDGAAGQPGERLRAASAVSLQGFERPRHFLARRALPLAPSTKIDHRRLSEEAERWCALFPASVAVAGRLWPARLIADGETAEPSWLVDGAVPLAPVADGETADSSWRVDGAVPLAPVAATFAAEARQLTLVREAKDPVAAGTATLADGCDVQTSGVRWLTVRLVEPLAALASQALVAALVAAAEALPGPPAIAIIVDADSALGDSLANQGFAAVGNSSFVIRPGELGAELERRVAAPTAVALLRAARRLLAG